MGSPTFRFAFGKGPLTVADAPWTSLTTNAVSTQFHRCEALVTATRQDRLRDPQLTVSFPQFVTNMQREEKCRKSKLFLSRHLDRTNQRPGLINNDPSAGGPS